VSPRHGQFDCPPVSGTTSDAAGASPLIAAASSAGCVTS